MKTAVQTYSVRRALSAMPRDTLREIAKIGFRELELWQNAHGSEHSSFFGLSASELRPLLTGTGLSIIGSHLSMRELSNIDAAIDFNLSIGSFRLCLTDGLFNTLDEIKHAAVRLNDLGEKLRRYGIKLYYHNSFHEFREIAGKPMLYHLADLTDPKLLNFELDTYWSFRGGHSPFKAMDYLGERIGLLHQTDFSRAEVAHKNCLEALPPSGEIDYELLDEIDASPGPVELGSGVLPIQSYIDRANELGCEYFVVEQGDTQLGELESLRRARRALTRYTGLDV